MEYHDQTFENKELLLDGNTYTGCTFRGCRLVIAAAKALPPSRLQGL